MWKVISLVLMLTACGKPALEQAQKLDPWARCVSRADNMAYCLIKEQPHLCDGNSCLPVQCGGVLPVLESGNGTKSDR